MSSPPVADPPGDVPVVELRRYAVRPGELDGFARRFDTWFPDVFVQLGASILGTFTERTAAPTFTWIRGFPSLAERLAVNTAFYGGPVWRERGAAMNASMTDYSNVLLLEPFAPGRGLGIRPEPEGEAGPAAATHADDATCVYAVVAPVIAERVGETAAAYEALTASGWSEFGLLRTLAGPDDFPALPVREDGPYLVWSGRPPVSGEPAPATRLGELAAGLGRTGLLRRPAEVLVLDPTPRSRLRG